MKLQAYVASLFVMVSLSIGIAVSASFALAQSVDNSDAPDSRPYDAQIYRLSEILGAVHYLRELCGADEGQVWRLQMRDLLNAEGTSALRRARLVDSFNSGYRGYARTYRTCTRPALQAIKRFMRQGAEITDALVENDR